MDAIVAILLVFIFLIGIAILIIFFLIGFGVWKLKTDVSRELEKQQNLLQGDFSFNQLVLGDRTNHVTKNTTNSNAILTNNTNLSCNSYIWNYKTYTNNKNPKNVITIDNALIWKNNPDLILTASNSSPGSKVVIEEPNNSNGTLNKWVFKDFTWCLDSNKSLCLTQRNDQLFIENLSVNQGFLWNIESPLSSPNCKS